MQDTVRVPRRAFLFACASALVAPYLNAGTTGSALPAYLPQVKVTGRLRFSGADTMHDLVAAWARALSGLQPHIEIDNAATKLSADGFEALLDGRADVVTFVREPFPAEIDAFTRRFGYAPTLINVAGGSYATKGGTHALAIFVNAANPTEPEPKLYCMVRNIRAAVAMAPTAFPTKATTQFSKSARVVTLRLAHAITIMLLPVNNSAPPTTTRMRPTENTTPMSNRVNPYGMSAVRAWIPSLDTISMLPAPTVVAKIAPNEMNAPAITLRTNTVKGSADALLTPLCSAMRAIDDGMTASNVTTCGGAGIGPCWSLIV